MLWKKELGKHKHNYSQFQNRLRQGSNFKHIYYISANYNYKEENLLPPFSFIEKVIRATRNLYFILVAIHKLLMARGIYLLQLYLLLSKLLLYFSVLVLLNHMELHLKQ